MIGNTKEVHRWFSLDNGFGWCKRCGCLRSFGILSVEYRLPGSAEINEQEPICRVPSQDGESYEGSNER